VDPATLLPGAPAAGGAGEPADATAINVKLTLGNVTFQQLLNAVVMVADHPIKYSVEDFGVVFSTKPSGPEPPILEMRVFKVDPNTFYEGLLNVSTFTFASANNNSGGNGGSGGGGGFGGGGGGGGRGFGGGGGGGGGGRGFGGGGGGGGGRDRGERRY
jgi:hypothetical protein